MFFHVTIQESSESRQIDDEQEDDTPFWNDTSMWKPISKAATVDRNSTSQLQRVIPHEGAATQVSINNCFYVVKNMLKCCFFH